MPYERVSAYTLVDITPSDAYRVRDSNKPEYHQMQNLNVLLQTIGLRAQPFNHEVSKLQNQNLADYRFGSIYTGQHTVWRLTFDHEHPMVWSNGEDEFASLKQDANNIAITSYLDNTADFPVNVFDTIDNVNLYLQKG